MPVHPTTRQDWHVVPPLDLPLTLRLENGRFGSLRPTPLSRPPPCATGQVIPADDPSNPTGADVHFINQIHEAVDLAASAGDCVFAAYSGRVVEVESDPAQTRGSVTIDHHPIGLGFLTKYLHITDIAVGPGDFLQKGAPFAGRDNIDVSLRFLSSSFWGLDIVTQVELAQGRGGTLKRVPGGWRLVLTDPDATVTTFTDRARPTLVPALTFGRTVTTTFTADFSAQQFALTLPSGCQAFGTIVIDLPATGPTMQGSVVLPFGYTLPLSSEAGSVTTAESGPISIPASPPPSESRRPAAGARTPGRPGPGSGGSAESGGPRG